MTKTSTVFDDTNSSTTTTVTDVTKQDTTTSEYLSQLVGDGKKFKTVEDLAKSKIEADSYIERLKAERDEALAGKATTDKLQEFLTKMEGQNNANSNSSRDNTSSVLGEDKVAEIVRNQLTKQESERTYQQNVLAAQEKVVGLYGDKAIDFLKSKSKELGISLKDMEEISAKSPTAFYNIVGLDKSKQADVNVTKGSVNTEANFNKDLKEGTWDYYNELRKKDKQTWLSPKIQNEIFKKASEGSLTIPQ